MFYDSFNFDILANYKLSNDYILRSLKMEEEKILKDTRLSDPYVDRRSGEDRRQVYDADYFQNGGLERRSGKERRRDYERRKDCTRVSEWSSICSIDKD
jgi:hypothetical protein